MTAAIAAQQRLKHAGRHLDKLNFEKAVTAANSDQDIEPTKSMTIPELKKALKTEFPGSLIGGN